ncbi:MAG: cysteine desulfurase family protein [Candidatus Methanomethylicia archaeon]
MSEVVRSVRGLLESHGEPLREVYLDSENSGLILPEALEEMVKTYRDYGYGHPSITHKRGWEAYEIIHKATNMLMRLIGVGEGEITYTHGGTEANNLAIRGLINYAREKKRRKIVYSSIEHLSVKFPAERLQKEGFKVVEIPVDKEGFININALEREIDKETLLVSIAWVNHEIGTIQDLRSIVEIVRDRDPEVYIHTDTCDALGRFKLDFRKMDVDLASFSSHKVYGPKGVGMLYSKPEVRIHPIIYGQLSTQELWPGVENVPAIAGLYKSLENIEGNLDNYMGNMRRLRDKLINSILTSVKDSVLNGPIGDRRAIDNVNISFLGCEGEALTVELSLRGVYVSSASACTSRTLIPSHVLIAIGRDYETAHGSLLMKITPIHSDKDIEYTIEQIVEAVDRIRSISPMRR